MIGLRAGWTTDRIPSEENFLFPNRPYQLWGQRILVFNVSRGYFARVQRPECNNDHSRLSSAEVKNEWSSSSTHQCALMAWTVTVLPLTFWRRIFFQILAHPVFKM